MSKFARVFVAVDLPVPETFSSKDDIRDHMIFSVYDTSMSELVDRFIAGYSIIASDLDYFPENIDPNDEELVHVARLIPALHRNYRKDREKEQRIAILQAEIDQLKSSLSKENI